MATGFQVNVSRAVESVLDMMNVIFSGGGWRSNNKIQACIAIDHVHAHHFNITLPILR